MVHELKTWPIYFNAILEGKKTFELRKDDRRFSKGDTLHLREWSPEDEAYSGRWIDVTVTYKTEGVLFGLKEGYCALAFNGIDASFDCTEIAKERP